MENINPYLDKPNRWSSHSRIATMLHGLPKNAYVLDVGAASGMLARICTGRGYHFRGIEPNPNWADETRNLYSEMFTGSLEQASDEYLSGNDAVVCGDVLEHLVDPAGQLRRLVSLQPDGCIFIISVPNITNIWIRINLLLGNFNYTDRGILDRTHLHFYTKNTFISLLKSAGLDLMEMQATPIPLELMTSFFEHNPVGKSLYALVGRLTKWWPTLFGYQWVSKAKKINQE